MKTLNRPGGISLSYGGAANTQLATSRTSRRLDLHSQRERTRTVSRRSSSWKYKRRQQRNTKWIKGSFITWYMNAGSWALTNKSGSKSKPKMWGRWVVVALHSTKVQGSICMLCSCPDGFSPRASNTPKGEQVKWWLQVWMSWSCPFVRRLLDELCNHLSAAGIGASVEIRKDI